MQVRFSPIVSAPISSGGLALPGRSLIPGLAQAAKFSFDFIIALLALVFLSPLLLAITAYIRTDGGPALYAQERIGRDGRRFRCFKFRSMVVDAERRLNDLLASDPEAAAEWAAVHKLTADPRVTEIGAFLRKTSLDEIPQLLNVLRGEMSLVGPRPIVQDEIARYGNDIVSYCAVRPGVTGLWQVSGRSDTTYARRIQLDVAYVKNWSLWRDISILFWTIPAVLLRRGAV
jgi:undecaprenyl-phosphate galactose phosphotransferase